MIAIIIFIFLFHVVATQPSTDLVVRQSATVGMLILIIDISASIF